MTYTDSSSNNFFCFLMFQTNNYLPINGFISRSVFPILLFHDFFHLPNLNLSIDGLRLEKRNLVCYLCFVVVKLSCLFIAALWSPAEKGLASWPSCMLCFIVLYHFSCGILCQV